MTHRTLHLNAFLMSVGHHEASWRLPESDPFASADVGHYQELARIAERGLMDSVFFADSPSLMTNPARRPAEAIEPTLLLAAMAAVTERIGLIATGSTTYDEPYNVARRFASLDAISRGRAGWNVVTSAAEDAGANFGFDTIPGHATRYARAQEFLEVVTGLWAGWEPDAVVADKASGVYADPARIRPLAHRGEHFSVRGPLNVGRSAQGWPVLVQAGSSPAGIGLAARFAEAVFTAQRSLDDGRRFYRELKAATARAGRNPDHLKVLPGIVPILGGTEEEALRLERELDDLMVHEHALHQLAEQIGVPPRDIDLDGPLPEQVRPTDDIQGNRSRYQLTLDMARREKLTVRQLLNRLGGGRGHRTFTGTPEQVADTLEEWFRGGAADGFNIMPAVLPSGLEAFVDHVVPLLQERGLFRHEYAGSTLRDHYGLPVPGGSELPLSVSQGVGA
jgi:FMN-dependent oxidoreductase (nitrilotriacetate monooxygenase family)